MHRFWWIKVRVDLDAQPEVMNMARALNVSPFEIVGRLTRFWGLIANASRNGYVARRWLDAVSPSFGGQDFVVSLMNEGWLKEDGAGDYIVPRFHKYLYSESEAGKRLRAERNARYRARRKAGVCVSPSQPSGEKKTPIAASCETVPASSDRLAKTHRGERDKELFPPTGVQGGELENPQEGKTNRRAKTELPPIPPSLDTPEFRAAWDAWVKDRAARRKPVTPMSATLSFNKMVGWGVERAVAAIHLSIESGWQGVYEARGAVAEQTRPKSLFDPPEAANGDARKRELMEEMERRRRREI